MARRGNGLKSAMQVIKTIDQINKRAMKDSEKKRRTQDRENARMAREYERQTREQEREAARITKNMAALEKKEFKTALKSNLEDYQQRCEERSVLRKKYINQSLGNYDE